TAYLAAAQAAPVVAEGLGEQKLRWLIDYWRMAAERSEAIASRVSGEGEAAEIYRDTETALRSAIAATQATPVVVEGLTLANLQKVHIERQEEWCPDQKPDL